MTWIRVTRNVGAWLAVVVATMSCATSPSHTAEFLENGNFSNPDPVLNNCQIGWMVDRRTRDGAQCLFGNGCATLKVTAAANQVFLLQRDLPLPPGHRYQVSYEVKGVDNCPYSIYIEWIRQDRSFRSFPDDKVLASPSEWKHRTFEFMLTEPHVRPYLAITLNGMGEASFRNLSIQGCQ